MTRNDIEETIKQFLVEELEIDSGKIAPEAKLKDDIGIDSLDFVDIAVIVNKKFGVKLITSEMTSVITFNDFCNYIEQQTTK